MNRSEQLMHWLAAQDGPRTTQQMRDAVAPCDDAKTIHAVISSMVKRGRLVRCGQAESGRKGTSLYALATDGLRDRRYKPPTAKQQPSVRRRAVRVEPKQQAKRHDVSADVAAYRAAGGRIQRLPRGLVSDPLKRIAA